MQEYQNIYQPVFFLQILLYEFFLNNVNFDLFLGSSGHNIL